MDWRKSSALLLLATALSLGTDAQPAATDTLSRASWEQAVEGLDYGDIVRPEPPEHVEPEYTPPENDYQAPDWDWTIPGLGELGTAILFGVVIIGLAYLLVFLVNRAQGSGRSRIKDGDGEHAYSFEELEEHIHETELEGYLRMALEESNFKAAVRVYYLMAIKALSENQWITWKRDKTNFDYVREMRKRPEHGDFRKLTYLFEVIWYGDTEIDQQVYRRISPSFDHFLKQLQKR
ncbi:MAG: DUF4129 domain-containing protein [Flavobacteriales bacterium]